MMMVTGGIALNNQDVPMESAKDLHKWEKCQTQVFWGEIAPSDHVVQMYESDEIFLNSLEMFVLGGIKNQECTIVIATENHLKDLALRLIQNGYSMDDLCKDDLYLPLIAEETLEQFMVNGWPDEILFNQVVFDLIAKARRKNRQVRAFGEMVAILWSQGHNGATVQLENLWTKFCEKEAFCLFCAYPKNGFTQDIKHSIETICCTHTKMIGGWSDSKKEIYYRPVFKIVSG